MSGNLNTNTKTGDESELLESPCSAGHAFGRWVRKARDFHSVSLDELAATSRVSKSQLSELENGKCKEPSIRVMQGIANAFGDPLWRVLRGLNI